MERLRSFTRGVDKFSERTGKIISFLIVPMIGVLMLEVVLRYLFNRPTAWAHELSQYIFGAHFFLAGGYATLHGHVNVDLVYRHLPRRTRAILDVVTSVFFFSLCAVFIYLGGRMAWSSLSVWEHSNTPWNPPVYPLKIVIPVGGVLFLVQGVAKFIRDLSVAITGRDER